MLKLLASLDGVRRVAAFKVSHAEIVVDGRACTDLAFRYFQIRNSAIEILVLHALASQALGDSMEALTALKRAVVLGESEGYIRIFLDDLTYTAKK